MQELVQKLVADYGISADQATGIISTVTQYLAGNKTNISSDAPPAAEESMLEKVKDFVEEHIPEGLKEKAEGLLGGAGDKIKGMFN